MGAFYLQEDKENIELFKEVNRRVKITENLGISLDIQKPSMILLRSSIFYLLNLKPILVNVNVFIIILVIIIIKKRERRSIEYKISKPL